MDGDRCDRRSYGPARLGAAELPSLKGHTHRWSHVLAVTRAGVATTDLLGIPGMRVFEWECWTFANECHLTVDMIPRPEPCRGSGLRCIERREVRSRFGVVEEWLL